MTEYLKNLGPSGPCLQPSILLALLAVVLISIGMVAFKSRRKARPKWPQPSEPKAPPIPSRAENLSPPPPPPANRDNNAPPTGGPSEPARQAPHELDRHLLNLVDLLDEIEGMKTSGGDPSGGLGIVESRLADLIELSDGEVIRDTEWRPDRQRAVAVEQGPDGAPRVLSSRKSGLAVGGRIVRKQEVVISNPEAST